MPRLLIFVIDYNIGLFEEVKVVGGKVGGFFGVHSVMGLAFPVEFCAPSIGHKKIRIIS